MRKLPRTGVIRDYDLHSPAVRIGYGLIYAVCIVMVVFAVFPLVWVVLAGFKDLREFMNSTSILPKSFDLDIFLKTWDQLGIAKNYLNSLISVAGSVLCALIFNGLLGYGLAILKPRGYGVVKKLVFFSLLMPTTISIVPLFMNIQRLGMGNSFLPLWLSYGANAMYIVLFIQFFESLPGSMIEASRIDGCTPLQTFFHIVLPLSKPIIVYTVINSFLAPWMDFIFASIMLNSGISSQKTVALGLFAMVDKVNRNNYFAQFCAGGVVVSIPISVLFIIMQKFYVEGITGGSVKG